MAFPFFRHKKIIPLEEVRAIKRRDSIVVAKRIGQFNKYKQRREELEAEMDHIKAQVLQVTNLMVLGEVPILTARKDLAEFKAQIKNIITKANGVNKTLNKILLELTEDDIKSIGEEE